VISLAVAAAGWVGGCSPGDYAAFKFPPPSRHDHIEKQAEPPSSWLDKNFPSAEQRRSYCDRHLLGDVPDDLMGFGGFYTARRDQLRERLEGLLAAKTQVA